jgi:ABC-type methionine transport system permease subunit
VLLIVLSLIVLVQLAQWAGNRIARRVMHAD